MRYNKIILAIFLVSLFAISAVSAADNATSDVVSVENNVTGDVVSVEETTDAISVEEADEVVSAEDNQVIGSTGDVGTFSELADSIRTLNQQGNLNLKKDYAYDDSFSIDGIIINEPQVTIDGQGHTIDAKGLSKIFNVQAPLVVIKNIVFKNAIADEDFGAAICGIDYSPSIKNCRFVNCSSYGGGAISSRGSDIEGCNFINCSAKCGGAIHCPYGGNIEGCSFINCSNNWGEGDGGAIYAMKDTNIKDCSFINCFGYTGVINLGDGGNIEGCTFINSTGYHDIDAGANIKKCTFINFISLAISGNVEGCTFINQTILDDSVIYLSGGSIKDCCFINFSAERGAAIYCGYRDCYIGGCTFINCSATDGGGAIYDEIRVNGLTNIKDCSFINCSATDGGAICSFACIIDGCSFVNCSAKYSGSAIHFGDGSKEKTIKNCDFNNVLNDIWYSDYPVDVSDISIEGNKYSFSFDLSSNSYVSLTKDYLTSSPIGVNVNNIVFDGNGNTFTFMNKSGRFFYITGQNVTLKNFVFNHSTVFSIGNNVTLINCTFFDCLNAAVRTEEGHTLNIYGCNFINCNQNNNGPSSSQGVIIIHDGSVRDSNFINCSAKFNQFGAVINGRGGISYSEYSVLNCSFINCSSNDSGGAIYYCPNVDNCIFVNCSARDSGGAIYKGFNVDNCIFVNCSSKASGGAIYYCFNADNCIFVNCSARDSGGAIYSVINIDVDNCSFVNCRDGKNNAIYFECYNLIWRPYVCNLSNSSFKNCAWYNASYINVYNVTINGIAYNPINNTSSDINTTKLTPEIVIPSFDNPSVEGFVIITLPSDATGKVTLTIDNQDYNFDVIDGKANVKLPELTNGKYPYYIMYSGDNKYSLFATNGSLNVNNAPAENGTDINATGNVTDENATDTNTTNTTESNTSETNLTAPEIVVPPLDKPSEDGSVEVKLPLDATGTVTLTVGGKDYVFDVVNGVANVKLPDLNNGDYPYTITYSGDNKYSSFNSSGSLKVNNTAVKPVENTTDINNTDNTTGGNTSDIKPTPEIVIPPLDEPSADGSVAINLPNDATGTVTLTVDGKNYTFDVKNGVADVKLPDLGDGNYDYTITYSGDSKYSSFKTNGNMKVNNTKPEDTKPTPEIVIPPLDEPSNEGSVKVTLPSDATGKVTLSIGGKDYIYLVENGVANVIIPNLGEGNYPYTITYSGDSKYSSFTTNGSLNKTVPKVDPKITAKNTAVQYSAKGKYSVTVYGTDGNVASGVQVIFKISGKQVGKAKTNTKGVASYVVTKNPGKYKIQATALGKSVTKTVTVKHIVTLKTVALKKSAKKLTLQATLAKVNGKYLKKKTITFKINGKKVATAKTNSKGVAKIIIKNPNVVKKLKVGKKITYQATYLKDTVKKTVKVKK